MTRKKIDIYTNVNVFGMRTPSKKFTYFHTTYWSKTCKDAKASFCAWHKLKPAWVKAKISK